MKYLYQNKHWPINEDYNIDKILYLMIDRPNIIIYDGFVWKNNKKRYHRDYDLPSDICFTSNKESINLYWNKKGTVHREYNKPAIIYYDGYKQYIVNGKIIKIEKLK